MAATSDRLGGKVAVVTGAASGIGAASAAAMAANGASVVLGDVNLAGAEKQAAAIREAGGNALAVEVNAADGGSIEALLAAAVAEFGGLDVLHNNALGIRRPAGVTVPIADYLHESQEGWFDALLHATVTSTMLGIKHAVPLLTERGGGSIINTASISGIRGEVFTPAYGAGKAGVIQLTRAAAAMYGRRGIRCNAICPGLIITQSGGRATDESLKESWRRHTPMNRLGRPEDIAHLAVYLAADESAYVTGQAIVVDGGFTMHDPTWADRLDAEGPAD
jgi:NAD(P)-dependent dehydrogenase (short-subunit alcohol dehydrogenase family)